MYIIHIHILELKYKNSNMSNKILKNVDPVRTQPRGLSRTRWIPREFYK